MNNVLSVLSTIPGIAPCRKGKNNFYAVPVTAEDGTVSYVAIKVSNLLTNPTEEQLAKGITPFNFEESKVDYANWKKEYDAKQNAPKKSKSVNTEAEARRAEQDKAMTEYVEQNEVVDMTATDLKNAIPYFAEALVMQVGSTALRLVDAGVLTISKTEGKKKFYSKVQG